MLVYSQQVLSGMDHFVLLAIPFFVLAGLLMEANGMSSRLIELLLRIREAVGSATPLPGDRMRDEEFPYAAFIAAQCRSGRCGLLAIINHRSLSKNKFRHQYF